MDLKEAKELIEINKDEKKSLDRYQGTFSAAINSLLSLNPSSYHKLVKDGWLLPKTKKDFKEFLDDFVNVDSAIHKYSKMHPEEMTKRSLLRGTGNSDVARLKKNELTTQFLSTTKTEEEAKSIHPEYGDAAIVTLNIGDDVPRINTAEFLNGKKDEKEYIIAPFVNVKDKKERSKWNGFTYYDIELKNNKKEEKVIDQKELAIKEKIVIDEFPEFLKALKEGKEFEDKVEQLSSLVNNKSYSREDRKEIAKDLEKAREKRDEIYEYIWNRNKSLQEIVEDKCYLKEKEIIEADKIIKEDERIKSEAKIRKILFQVLHDTINDIKDRGNDFVDVLGKSYDDVLKNDELIRQKSIVLGLENKDKISTEIGGYIGDIFYSIQRIDEKTDEMYYSEKDKRISNELVKNKISKLVVQKSLYDKMEINDFTKIADKYRQSRMREFKKDIHDKAQDYIKKAKKSQLDTQIEIKEGEKIGFFERLFGKEKVRNLELENLKLKKKQLDIEPEEENIVKEYDIKETLAELYKVGNMEISSGFTKDVNKYYSKVLSEFYPKNAEIEAEIHDMAKRMTIKSSSDKLDISKYVRKERNREKIERLKEENNQISIELKNDSNKPSRIRVFDSTSSKASKRQMKFVVEGYKKLLEKSILINEDSMKRENNFKESINERRKSRNEKEIDIDEI